MAEWRNHDGRGCPVDPDQLVQLICVGEGAKPWLTEAGSIGWEWRNRAGTTEPHHGNIVRWRPVSQVKVTIIVDDLGNSSVGTKASLMPESAVRPMIDRALAALQAERDGIEACPYHRDAP